MTNTPDQLDLEGGDPERKIAEMIWWSVEPITAEQAEPSVEDYLPAAKTILSRLRAAEAKAAVHDRAVANGWQEMDALGRATTAEALATSQAETIRGLVEAVQAALPLIEIGAKVEFKRYSDMHIPGDTSIAGFIGEDKIRATLKAVKAVLSRTPAGEARPDTGSQWSTAKPPEVAGQYISVRTVTTFRWLPYKPDGARQMKKAGRWQQVRSQYGGWENADFPEGAEWAPNLPVSRVADTGSGEESGT